MIERLARRILMAIGVGRATAPTIETGPTQIVQAAFPGDLISGQDLKEVPSVQSFGFASALKAGADVVALFLSGDRSKGVVIASNDQRYRPTGLLPGEVMIYDAFGHSIHLTAAGIVSTGNWTHTGNLVTTGALMNNGKNVGSTHQHLDSGGSGLGGVPE